MDAYTYKICLAFGHSSTMHAGELDAVRIPKEFLDVTGDVVAQGGMGDVYPGIYRRGNGVKEHVAVKAFRLLDTGNQSQEDIARRLVREASVWKKTKHPHVLEFYGVYEFGIRTTLVSPWLPNGNVHKYLASRGLSEDTGVIFSLNANISGTLLFLGDCQTKQIASGVEYLHMKNIVHGDIKGNNLLVDDSGNIKITDFGRAFIVDEIERSMNFLGCARWAAPELLTHSDEDEDEDGQRKGEHDDGKGVDEQSFPLSKNSDMWALGITFLELLDGINQLWGGNLKRQWDVKFLLGIARGRKPVRKHYPRCSSIKGLWDGLNRCWELKPEERINANDFVQFLASIRI